MSITKEAIRRLAEMEPGGQLVASLYFPPGDRTEGEATLRLRSLMTQALEGLDSWEPERSRSVEEDLGRLESLVAEERVRGTRGLAAFASSPLGLWKVFRLPLEVREELTIDLAPRLAPLMALWERWQRCCLALVDKGRARLYLIDWGEVIEQSDLFGELPGRHDQGGWAQARYQRHHEDHAMRHLKYTAEEVFRLQNEAEFDCLVVGGTEELVSQFVDYLHPYLRERLIATLPLEMMASSKEVQREALAILEKQRTEEEERLFERLKGEVLSGKLGAVGLEDTLHALQAGQVKTLLVSEGQASPGSRCSRCHSLTARQGACPYCGAPLEPRRDVVEEMIRLAFLGNAEIKFLAGERGKALAEMGGIGALLRF